MGETKIKGNESGLVTLDAAKNVTARPNHTLGGVEWLIAGDDSPGYCLREDVLTYADVEAVRIVPSEVEYDAACAAVARYIEVHGSPA